MSVAKWAPNYSLDRCGNGALEFVGKTKLPTTQAAQRTTALSNLSHPQYRTRLITYDLNIAPPLRRVHKRPLVITHAVHCTRGSSLESFIIEISERSGWVEFKEFYSVVTLGWMSDAFCVPKSTQKERPQCCSGVLLQKEAKEKRKNHATFVAFITRSPITFLCAFD